VLDRPLNLSFLLTCGDADVFFVLKLFMSSLAMPVDMHAFVVRWIDVFVTLDELQEVKKVREMI
jgi:hypothetical protein